MSRYSAVTQYRARIRTVQWENVNGKGAADEEMY